MPDTVRARRHHLRDGIPVDRHFYFVDEDLDVLEDRQSQLEESIDKALKNMNRLLITLLVSVIGALAIGVVGAQ